MNIKRPILKKPAKKQNQSSAKHKTTHTYVHDESTKTGGKKATVKVLGRREGGAKPAKPPPQPTGATQKGGKQDFWRFATFWFGALLLACALIVRAFYVQVMQASHFAEYGNSFIYKTKVQNSKRGAIYDRNGMALAVSAPLVTVVFDAKAYAKAYYGAKKALLSQKKSVRDSAQKRLEKMDLARLSELSGTDIGRLQKLVGLQDIDVQDDDAVERALPSGNNSQHFVLFDRVPPERVGMLRAANFVGVSETQIDARYYPESLPSAQILGYMTLNGNHYVGASGLEKKYDALLMGHPHERTLAVDGRGKAFAQIDERRGDEGKDVHLTLDARLQYVLYSALEEVGSAQRALWASGIVVDIDTGEVLAISAWPSFNNNNLHKRTGNNERARPLLDAFEPGSVMKPFTVAAALESGKYAMQTMIDTTPGSLVVGGYRISDSSNYGNINLATLIQKSSNVGSAKIALSLPSDAISSMQRRFGFGQRTAIDFPSETAGKVNDPNPKAESSIATLSYGYGQQISLAQLAQAYAVIGARGEMRPLHLVQGQSLPPPRKIISPNHAQQIIAMMELVTQKGGTGQRASVNGYRVAGKTGTTKRADPAGGYYKDRYRATFAGMAPASQPKYVVVISVEDPQEEFYGGQVAAPPFAKVMKEALRLGGIKPDAPMQALIDAQTHSVDAHNH